MIRSELAAQLKTLHEQSLYRQCLVNGLPAGPEVLVDGERLLAFNSNDYLGLANHPRVREAFVAGIGQWGVGSGSAHLVSGHSRAHEQLEQQLATFTGHQRALLFSSGYLANLALVNTFTRRGDVVFQDRLNHASLLDAGTLSHARLRRYQHADMDSLQRMLTQTGSVRKMIVSDGVFSMDGDVAPLTELAALAREHDALLAIDDAHGFGILGEQGAGTLQQAGMHARQVPLLMATLGKALGCAGAFIAGDEVFIETLIQKARSYIYTTAQPPALAVATSAALQLVSDEAWRREHLHALVQLLRDGARQLQLPLMPSQTPIQPLLAGTAERAIQWSQFLRQHGILVTPIRPPTVPAGSARLRITLSASHTRSQVERLLEILAKLPGRGDPA